MKSEIRHKLSGEQAQTKVLNNQGIDLSRPTVHKELRNRLELFGEDQHIEGEEALDPSGVQPTHDLREITPIEILSSQTGIEDLNSEVHRIGSSSNGGPECLPVSSWCQELWRDVHCQRPSANRRAGSNARSACEDPSNRQCQGS